MACPFGNLSFHIDACARLYGSLRRSAIRGQAFLRHSCAVTRCVTFLRAPDPFSRFTGAHRFPLQRKCGRTHCALPDCTGAGTRRLFDKISAAAFFLSRRSPNENGRFPAAENLPRGKPIAGTASAVRNTISPCGQSRLLQSEAHKGFLILLAVPRSENVFDYSYLAVLLGIGVLNR